MKALILVLLAASPGMAQSSWLSSNQKDSDNPTARQTLTLRGSYLSSSTARPNVTLVCQNGKLISSSFNTVPVAREGDQNRTPPDKMPVAIRVGEKKTEFKDWKLAGGPRSLRPNAGFVKELVSAQRVDVEFSTSSSARMTAEFVPSPVDAPRIRKACGIH